MRVWIIDKLARLLRVLVHVDGKPYGLRAARCEPLVGAGQQILAGPVVAGE